MGKGGNTAINQRIKSSATKKIEILYNTWLNQFWIIFSN